MRKIYEFLDKHIRAGGWRVIIAIAIFGIVLKIIEFYVKCGFDLKRFLTFDLPLYIFWTWASYKGIYLPIKNNRHIFK